MSVSVQVEPETGVAIICCSGVMGRADAEEGATALWRAPGWAGKSAIWDFRDARFDLSSAEVREMAQFILRHQPVPPPSRVAFVTGRDVDFGLARMYEAHREDSRTAFRVFRDYDEAVRWTGALAPEAP